MTFFYFPTVCRRGKRNVPNVKYTCSSRAKKICFSFNKVLHANVVVVAPMHASTTRARYEVKYKKSQVNVLTSDKRCKKQWWVP